MTLPVLDCRTPEWESLSMKERAIAVGRDVKSLLQARHIVAESGIYIGVNNKYGEDADAQKVLEELPCEVCAIGALAVAKILGQDKAKMLDLGFTNECYYPSREKLCFQLSDVFYSEALSYMERAFERNWKEQYYDDTARLDAIMDTVIENGDFTKNDCERYGVIVTDDFDDLDEEDDEFDDWDDEEDFLDDDECDDDDYEDDWEDDDWDDEDELDDDDL